MIQSREKIKNVVTVRGRPKRNDEGTEQLQKREREIWKKKRKPMSS